jgi:hypothetical protein
MAYKNKTYVCFDGDTDMHYYRLMTAWAKNDDFEFNFYNAHDLNTARDDSQTESIKRQLRIRFANSKDFIVLIGEKTKGLRRFIPWEIEVAIGLALPIVGINLNGNRRQDDRCPNALKDALAMYVPFQERIMTYAFKDWPARHKNLTDQGKTGPYFYQDTIYKSVGL